MGACGACGVAGESLQAVSSARRITANSAAGENDLIAVVMGSGSSFQRCSGVVETSYRAVFIKCRSCDETPCLDGHQWVVCGQEVSDEAATEGGCDLGRLRERREECAMTTSPARPSKGAVFKDGRWVIKFGRTERRVVRLVGRMPFVSFRNVCDLLGLDGYQSTRVIMENLEALGHVTSLKTANPYRYGQGVKRFVLTVRGIRRLAELERIEVPDALKRYPVSLQWRRVLLRRLEALEVYYKLCCFAALARREGEISFGKGEDVGGPGEFAVGEPSGGTLFWWRRTGWLDGTVVFGQGKGARRVRVLRIGSVGVRRAILHRLGSMMLAYGDRGIERIVIVVPGYTELRLVEHWLRANTRFIQAYCVIEHELKEARAWEDVVFIRPGRYGSAYFSLSEAFGSLRGRPSREGRLLDEFEPYAKIFVPGGSILKNGRNDRGILLGASLSRRERICLQAVADWPLALRGHLLGLQGVSQVAFASLFDLGLIYYVWDDGHARVLLSDAGMRYVAWRDRSNLGVLRKRWAPFCSTRQSPICPG